MRLLLWFCIVVAAAMPIASASSQQQPARVALVIGNASYPDADPSLLTTISDARAVSAELMRDGFTVETRENVRKQEMQDVIDAFIEKIGSGTAALFYFSGYGIQVERQTFLIPINANIWKEADARREGVSIDRLLAEMTRRAAKAKIVIIDAARRNPFERRFRTAAAGLHASDTPEGTLAMYSTGPGKLIDGDGGDANSVFANELVKQLRDPDLTAEQAFNRVRIGVARATNNAQIPWVSSSLVDEFHFAQGATAATASQAAPSPTTPTPQRPDPCAGAAESWRSAQDVNSVSGFEDHLARFPDCEFADLARARIQDLKKKEIAAVAPPAPATPPPSPVQPSVGIFPAEGATPLSAEREAALEPKDVFKECQTCPEMVVVPPGSFIMGSRPSERGRSDNEGPQHPVKIAKALAVARFQVTVDQFREFLTEGGYDAESKCYVFEGGKLEQKQGRSWRNPGFTQTGTHPAVCVNWNDAKAYAAWLSRKTGKTYRLLTEAEREYAARAGSTSRYSFGDEEKDVCRYGNGADQTARSTITGASNWTIAPCSDGYAYTAPVGSFLPNAFALHDVHGNAWEWVEDCWHPNYAGAPADASAWTSGDCSIRTVRGGAWWIGPNGLRSAMRGRNPVDNRHDYVGFRLARTLDR